MEKLLRKTLANGRFDHVNPERSRTMSKIRGKRNKSTEIKLKMGFVRAGMAGFQLHPSTLPGKPDFYFRTAHLAIFVDGCFWHGCAKCGHIPKTNTKFWAMKIRRNAERDARNMALLKRQKIKAVRFWEHQLQQNRDMAACIRKVRRLLSPA